VVSPCGHSYGFPLVPEFYGYTLEQCPIAHVCEICARLVNMLSASTLAFNLCLHA
jgi:hypothetical protein